MMKEPCSMHGMIVKALAVMVGAALTYAGASINFAMDIRSTVSAISTICKVNGRDVEELKSRQNSIDSKLDLILSKVSEGR